MKVKALGSESDFPITMIYSTAVGGKISPANWSLRMTGSRYVLILQNKSGTSNVTTMYPWVYAVQIPTT